MEPHATHDELGPGIHALSDEDPLARASAMAVELRAELCVTVKQADAVLASRSALPRIDAELLDTARGLATRLARAERIATRTRERAALEVGERLAGSAGGLAVHPSTIRDRAATVERAQASVADAEQALRDHEADMAAFDRKVEAEVSVAAERADQEDRHLRAEHLRRSNDAVRRTRIRTVVVLLVSVAVGATLVAAGVPWWSAALPAVLAVAWAVNGLRATDAADDDDVESRLAVSSLLSQVGTTADELFQSRRAESELGQQASLLEARRDRALEELRVAERSWRELAGDEVGIDQLDEVIRRYDPQHEDARLLAAETVGVRTTEAVVRQFEERWLALWDKLDRPAPAAADAEAAAEALVGELARAIVLVGEATARVDALAEASPAATIVVLNGPVGAPGAPGVSG